MLFHRKPSRIIVIMLLTDISVINEPVIQCIDKQYTEQSEL